MKREHVKCADVISDTPRPLLHIPVEFVASQVVLVGDNHETQTLSRKMHPMCDA